MVSLFPDRIGDYRIVAPLGRGGMGVVYRAEHERSRAPVALKTVSTPDPDLLQSIRREIAALSRLRHPGIVSIVDHGISAGVPWYAMELVEGRTLGRYARDLVKRAGPPDDGGRRPTIRFFDAAGPMGTPSGWWTQALDRCRPEPAERPEADRPARLPKSAGGGALQELLTVVRRLCAPLGYMHGEDIVHRDLKPGNVLVTAAAAPVILDFGLVAGGGGRERIEAEGEAVGTVAYVAPEQGQGELVDARADLYALGCILFELVTGRPPFVGTTPLEILQRRYGRDAPSMSDLVDGVPPELDRLVGRLLARDPRERIGYAQDVADALAPLGAGNGIYADAPRPRIHLYRAGLVGRTGASRALSGLRERLAGGRGGCVLLTGESGVGKTRLLTALVGDAAGAALRVLSGECSLEGSATPFGAIGRPLREIGDECRQQGAARTATLLGERAPLLEPYEPGLAGLPGAEGYPAPPELPPPAAHGRLLGSVVETFAAVAAERPLLLVLDDLQWADDLSLDLLRVIVKERALEAAPVLVIGAYRPEEAGTVLGELASSPDVELLELGRLDASSVAEMAAEMLALDHAPLGLATFLNRHSEGNPFFVGEYLRGAVDEGLLTRTGAGRWQLHGVADDAAAELFDRIPTPPSIRDLATRRLEGLTEGARGLVDAASVLGREVGVPLLLVVAGRTEEQALPDMQRLVGRLVLEEPRPGALRFAHDRIREAAHAALSPSRRSALHGRAAAAIDALAPAARERRLAELGRHWQEAGDATRAREAYLGAARRAAAQHAFGEAVKLYAAYLSLVEAPSEESISARNEMGERIRIQGRLDDAERQHRIALAEAAGLQLVRAQAISRTEIGRVLRIRGRVAEAEQLFAEALGELRAVGDRRAQGIVMGDLAGIRHLHGDARGALDLWRQVLAIHREVGDRTLEGIALTNVATLHRDTGAPRRGLELMDDALAINREQGNVWFEGIALVNRALMLVDLGRLDEGIDVYEAALALQRGIGDRHKTALTLANLAGPEMALGRLDQAQGHLDEALSTAEQLGDRHLVAYALGELGMVRERRGDVAGAEEVLERALAIQGELEDPRGEAMSLGNLGRLRERSGRRAAALAAFTRAREIGAHIGDPRNEAINMVAMARTLDAAQRPDVDSLQLLGGAARMLRAVGDDRELLVCLCDLGHARIAAGRPARAVLRRAEAARVRLGQAAADEVELALERLRHAVIEHDARPQ